MKKAFTIMTLIVCCFSMMQQMSAQIEFSMPDAIDLNCGDSFCMPVTSTGFVSIGSLTGSINWDATTLQYTGVSNAALPDFSAPNNINELGASEGQIGFVWFDATGLSPLTLGAGTTVFEVCFEVFASNDNSSSIVEFSDMPTVFSVAQQSSEPTSPPLPLTFTLNSGTAYFDFGCGSSSLTCNNHINITVDPWSCGATLSPDMALEGGPYDYSVMEIEPQELTGDDIGVDVQYTVTNTLTGNTCWGYITLEDKTPPVPVVKQNIRVSLGADCSFKIDTMNLGTSSYDSCSEVSYTIEPNEFDESDIGFQDVLLVVEDASGNSNSIYFEIEVIGDHCAERLQVYDQVNLVLNGNEPFILDPEMLIINHYSNYNQFAVAPFSVDTSDIGDQPYLVTALDDESDWGTLNVCETATTISNCGKIVETIGPSQKAIVTIDQLIMDISYACTEKGYLRSFSNRDNDVTTKIVDCTFSELTGGSSNTTAYLWTGNILVDSCSFHLQVLDGAGYCDNTVNNTTLTCNAFIQVSADPWSCSAFLTPQMALEGGPYDYSSITITPNTLTQINTIVQYTVQDTVTGNLCWGTIKLEDKSPPIAIAKQNIQVGLATNPTNPQELSAKLSADAVDNGSHDGNCGPVAFKPEYWEFTCADIGEQTITLEVWDDADGDGMPGSSSEDNFNITWATVTVQAPLGIVLVCPSAVVIDCSEEVSDVDVTGIPEVTLGCQSALTYEDTFGFDANEDGDLYDEFTLEGVTVSEDYSQACNSGTIERRWQVGDSDCLQRIVVLNNTQFERDDITWPADTMVECHDDSGQPIWESIDGCALIGWTLESQIFPDGANGCNKILNTYSVINWCEYDPLTSVGIWTHTSVVQLEPTVAPVLLVSSADLSGCDDLSISSVATSEACPDSGLKWRVSLDVNSDGTVDAIWSSFTPEDGNTTASPLWDDDDGDGIPEVRVGNTGGVDNATSNKVQSGAPYKINIPSWISFDNNPSTPHNVLWEVFNECGLSAGGSSTLFVGGGAQDLKAPTPYCVNLSTALVGNTGIELFAVDFNLGSFDNCTVDDELRFTFTDVPPPARCDAEYGSNSDLHWYDGSQWFYDSEVIDTEGDNGCAYVGYGEYSDGGYDPNTSVFEEYRDEIHRWMPGLSSSGARFTADQTDASGFMQLPIYVWDDNGNKDFCLVSLRLIEDNSGPYCIHSEEDINWPDPFLEVHSGNATNIGPQDLMTLYGFTDDQVLPIIPDCGIYTYDDVLIDSGNGFSKLIRQWTVLDWLSAQVYEFNQIITIYSAGLSNICDFLPNNTPFTDCDNGHSMDDDVEWPADITIADHRITPENLIAFSAIQAKDAQPIFYNDAANYVANYENFIPVFEFPLLNVERRWTVSHASFIGSSAEYTQIITVDLTDILGLVGATTMGNRPIPDVQITPQDYTGETGVVVVDDNALINPSYSDVNHNGLTIRDLVLIQRHLLGLDLLEGYAVYAADFDQSMTINGVDLVEMRKHLVGRYSDDIDWVFIERAAELTEFGIRADYVGVKPGDIDDSAAIGNDIPVNETVQFQIPDALINNGESYGIPVQFDSPAIFSNALHLSLDFDESALELLGVTSETYNGFIDYHLENNILNIVVFSSPTIPALIDQDLITIQVKAKENTTVANVIGFNGDRPSHILTDAFVLYDMDGEVGNTFGSGTHELDGNQIAIYPNPATDFITVDIPATITEDYSFELMDISGKSILKRQNVLSINLTEVPNGMYLYKFMIGNKLFSDKIIIQK